MSLYINQPRAGILLGRARLRVSAPGPATWPVVVRQVRMDENCTILVTGATGNCGGACARFLLANSQPAHVQIRCMVRDVASRLNGDERIERYVVEAENFESIHNHSAYAQITFNRDA